MKEPIIYREALRPGEEAISLIAVGSAILRYRRVIIALGLFGAVAGLATALLSKRVYSASATFIPESGDNQSASGLALAAASFGIRLPSGGSGWGPAVYVELLKSPALLEPIAADTLSVPEESRRRIALAELLRVKDAKPALKLERSVRALRKKVTVQEEKKLGAVKLTVTTRWPSVSFAVANRLVLGVNQFNLETRKTQAGAERRFVQAQAIGAEHALREAENRFKLFLQGNRGGLVSSPDLALERDRLERDVTFRQQAYTTLSESHEEAKIREVRNTPLITVIEQPRLPVMGEARHSVTKALLGGIAGVVIGLIIAFIAEGVAGARTAPTQEAREFFELIDKATPRFLRRG